MAEHQAGTPINEYKIVKPLGQGGSGNVVLVKNPHNEHFAAKIIRVGNRAKEDVRKEAMLHGGLDHPNILPVREYFFWDNEQHLVIISSYCDQGSLGDIIGSSQLNLQRTMLEAAQGVQYLHSKWNIVHRDIKPENIMIKGGRPLIGDLGISRTLKGKGSGAHTKIGTHYYMAPEMHQNDEYGYSVDVWSLGLVFLEMCANKRLNEIIEGALYPYLRPQFPSEDVINQVKPPHLRKLIRSMLVRDPSKRLTIEEVVVALGGVSSTPTGNSQIHSKVPIKPQKPQENQIVRNLYQKTEDYWYLRYPEESLRKDYISHVGVVEQQAEKGNKKAMYLMGRMYAIGVGVPLSNTEAKHWFTKCAAVNEPFCFANLYNLEKEPEAKQEYVKKGVSLGDARSCQVMGRLLTFGTNGFPKNTEQGIRLLKKSAEKGFPEALYWLGRAHCSPEPNFSVGAQAEPYFKKAAVQGHKKSIEAVGRFYDAKGFAADAIKWYEKAYMMPGETIGGQGILQCNMGLCYYDIGDRKKAKQLFRVAASLKNVFAADRLNCLKF